MRSIIIKSLHHLDAAARSFQEISGENTVIAFSGEMGAGKTTFIQALCRALGVSQQVSSPTFGLINEYFTNSGDSIYHFDLYRIEDPGELFDMGYEDYFYSGARCFIEWPEKASHLIPDDALWTEILTKEDGSREIRY